MCYHCTSISIHAPNTGSDEPSNCKWSDDYISIHAPNTGSDLHPSCNNKMNLRFQSTLPIQGATRVCIYYILVNNISIHAPNTGSDFWRSVYVVSTFDFNPRSQYRERPGTGIMAKLAKEFQSTLPIQGATKRTNRRRLRKNFNPRSQYRERPAAMQPSRANQGFQSTLPIQGATSTAITLFAFVLISIHAPNTGSDAPLGTEVISSSHFNPRSQYRERLPLRFPLVR